MADTEVKRLSGLVWAIAEILRGSYKQSEYGKVILPFVVLRRLDGILKDTKEAVLAQHKSLPKDMPDTMRDNMLYEAAGAGTNMQVYNLSKFTFESLKGQDAKDIHKNLTEYIRKFSPNIRDIFFERFRIAEQLKRLNDDGLLYRVFDKFAGLELDKDEVSNTDMGYLFEDVIRRFSEISNETAGEHFTPREVIRLIVALLLVNDKKALTGKGIIRQVYDPAAGTGGMLAIAEEEMKKLNPDITVELYGQELNPESFAICKSDMLVTDHNPENIAFGNTLADDAHPERRFHYMLSNPPYGVNWDKYQAPIKREHETRGHDGRFGAGLPRISDGQLLFLQHMISKMRQDSDGSRIGIVMNGSPLFTGGAQSGESEIRRWMLENDMVEAIIALPTDLFYNTGIQTYVWLLSNHKAKARHNKVQLIDASGERFWQSMRKNLGAKRREIPEDARHEISRIYSDMLNGDGDCAEFSKIFDTTEFGYREIRVERPLRLAFEITDEGIENLRAAKPFQKLDPGAQDEIINMLQSGFPAQGGVWLNREEFTEALEDACTKMAVEIKTPIKKAIMAALSRRDENADICRDAKGNAEPDTDLRDHELVPLLEDWKAYFAREVAPFVKDAWVDEEYVDKKDGKVGRVGYEINFNRYFYKYVPPRPLAEIDAELRGLEKEIAGLMGEMAHG